jgi:hypothetical protein
MLECLIVWASDWHSPSFEWQEHEREEPASVEADGVRMVGLVDAVDPLV